MHDYTSLRIHTMTWGRVAQPLRVHTTRYSFIIRLTDTNGRTSLGEIAPLPGRSRETLERVDQELHQYQAQLCAIQWSSSSWHASLACIPLSPATSFGFESALLALLDPMPHSPYPISAFLSGAPHDILQHAMQRYAEGYRSAKIKVGQLSPHEAIWILRTLQPLFHLRVDVNRAWDRTTALQVFASFSPDSFDFIEEPFQNPKELVAFPHPLAIDESYPDDLTLEELSLLPQLKALIYKPMLQGGFSHAVPLVKWARANRCDFLLSSTYEGPIGLSHIAALAQRLHLPLLPLGLGTYTEYTRLT